MNSDPPATVDKQHEIFEVCIPELGEGLQEVRILQLFKNPGDSVSEEEVFYSLETDKASAEIEAPRAGILVRWLVEEGAVVPVGSPVALFAAPTSSRDAMPTADTSLPEAGTRAAQSRSPGRFIPPRTRAHAREFGLSAEELQRVPAQGRRLTPEDVDRYLDRPGNDPEDLPLSRRQQVLNHRFRRSHEQVIPATLFTFVDVSGLTRGAEGLLAAGSSGAEGHLSAFLAFAWCVARAVRAHPVFRSVATSDRTRRLYPGLQLGVAVNAGSDELLVATIDDADSLAFPDFAAAFRARVTAAMEGHDQVSERTQLVLSYLGDVGVVGGVPVLMAPASAVIYLGSPHPGRPDELQISMTFEHRLVNGVEAAAFLACVARCVRELAEGREPTPEPPGFPPVSEAGSGESELIDSLRGAPNPEEALRLLEVHVQETLATLLGQGPTETLVGESFAHLGMDSMCLMRLRAGLQESLGLELPVAVFWTAFTAGALARELASRLDISLPRSGQESLPQDASERIQQMGRSELETEIDQLISDSLTSGED